MENCTTWLLNYFVEYTLHRLVTATLLKQGLQYHKLHMPYMFYRRLSKLPNGTNVETTSNQSWFNVLTLNQRWIDVFIVACLLVHLLEIASADGPAEPQLFFSNKLKPVSLLFTRTSVFNCMTMSRAFDWMSTYSSLHKDGVWPFLSVASARHWALYRFYHSVAGICV